MYTYQEMKARQQALEAANNRASGVREVAYILGCVATAGSMFIVLVLFMGL